MVSIRLGRYALYRGRLYSEGRDPKVLFSPVGVPGRVVQGLVSERAHDCVAPSIQRTISHFGLNCHLPRPPPTAFWGLQRLPYPPENGPALPSKRADGFSPMPTAYIIKQCLLAPESARWLLHPGQLGFHFSTDGSSWESPDWVCSRPGPDRRTRSPSSWIP